MDEIWKVIEGVGYPADRHALVDHATAAGAPRDLVKRLEALPQERYEDVDQLGRDLTRSRAASNPALVTITAEICDECGFARLPGQAHSCIEEKARFAETVNKVTDEFEILDDSRRDPDSA